MAGNNILANVNRNTVEQLATGYFAAIISITMTWFSIYATFSLLNHHNKD